MSGEKKLAAIIQADPTMVRRSSDIEVDEITLTKQGALGDQADAIVLLKETVEEVVEETAEEAVITEEAVAVLEKEEPTEEVAPAPELDFDTAVAFLQKCVLTEDQKSSLVDVTLDLSQSLEKSGNDTPDITEPVVESAFPTEAMELLKSLVEAVAKLSPQETTTEELEVTEAVIAKSEDNTKDIVVPSLADSVGMQLLKAQDERKAQGRAEQDASLMNAVSSLSASLSAVTAKLEASGQKLNRACGQDA